MLYVTLPAAAQTPARQMELRQSALIVQLLLAVHWGHDGPPQSTPVSAPFLMPSEQFAVGGVATQKTQS